MEEAKRNLKSSDAGMAHLVKDGKSTLHQEMLPVGGQSGHLVVSISYWTLQEMDRLTLKRKDYHDS